MNGVKTLKTTWAGFSCEIFWARYFFFKWGCLNVFDVKKNETGSVIWRFCWRLYV